MEMNNKKRRQSMILYVLIAVAVMFAINQSFVTFQQQKIKQVTYSEFLTMVDTNKVR
jgi:cell division protease FtsH